LEEDMNLKRHFISGLLILIAFLSCDLDSGDTYNNDYADDWYMKKDETSTDFDSLKMEMSDQHFKASITTLSKSDLTGDDYQGLKKGDIEKSGDTLTISVKKIYIETVDRWYSREEYYDYLVDDLKFSSTTANTETNNNFYTRTVDYAVGSSPESLQLGSSSDGDLFGTFYTTIYDALTN
jgi:hypothetical protein